MKCKAEFIVPQLIPHDANKKFKCWSKIWSIFKKCED